MFKGSMVALVTPMLDDGSVDHDALAELVEFHVEAGTEAIVAVGTSGESATLSGARAHDRHRQRRPPRPRAGAGHRRVPAPTRRPRRSS